MIWNPNAIAQPVEIVLFDQDKKALAAADEDSAAVTSALQSVQEKTSFSPERQKEVSALNERFTDIHTRSKALYSGMIDHPENMTAQTQQGIATLAQDNKQMETSLRELGSGLAKDFQTELDVVSTWNQRQRTFGIVVLLIAFPDTVDSVIVNWLPAKLMPPPVPGPFLVTPQTATKRKPPSSKRKRSRCWPRAKSSFFMMWKKSKS